MPSVKISEFQSTTMLSGGELLPIVQDGVNRTTTVSSLSSVVGAPVNTPIFITNIVNNTGLLQKTYVSDTIPVNYLVSDIVVDTADSITVTIEWDGPGDVWNGIPTLNGQPISTSTISRIGTTRRFTATTTIDIQGENKIIAEVEGGSYEVAVQLLGTGPAITNITFGQPPITDGHQPTMFIDGDSVDITVEFDTNDVASVTLYSGNSYATASGVVNVTVTGTSPPSATFTGIVDTSLDTITQLPIKITAKNQFGSEGDEHISTEFNTTIPVREGPEITNVKFGSYPSQNSIFQTELKDEDTISVTFEFDTNNVTLLDFNSGSAYASKNQNKSVSTQNLSASTVMTIDTSVQTPTDQPIRVRPRSSHNSYGVFHTSSDKLTVNNVYPSITGFSVTYPANQLALKGTETADVILNVSNQGSTPTYTYDNPRGEITIPDPSTYPGNNVAKTVTCTNPGNYNISSNNFKLTVNRQENNATSTYTGGVVYVADELPTLSVTHNGGSRLRSGGNSGTSAIDYSISCNSDQRLTNFSMVPPTGAGTFTGSWSSTSNGTSWTMNSLQVHDNDTKGTHLWGSVTSTNLSNMQQTTLNSGSGYIIGGFVNRTLIVSRLSRYAEIGTYVSDNTKLVMNHSWPGTWTYDTSLADGTILNPNINSGEDIEFKYTIVSSLAPTVVDSTGDWVFILDRDAVASNNNTISPATVEIAEVV